MVLTPKSWKIRKVTLWPSPGGDGAEVIYALRNNATLSNTILSELEKSGQNVREAFQKRLPSNTSKDYYFIHRDTGKNTEPVIVEYGFLDSTGDDPKQLKEDSELYAEAVVRAVMKYIGKPYSGGNIEGTYTVKSGDSVWSIANRFGTTVAVLKELNNLNTNELSVGQVLKLPGSTSSSESGITSNTYTVKSGDSLWSIARKHNTTVSEIQKLNQLSSTLLQVGQVLKLPGSTSSSESGVTSNTYTVKSGDSLWSIANRFGVTVKELMDYNNLNSNLLSIGQVLKIPTNSSSPKMYIVKAGDTIFMGNNE